MKPLFLIIIIGVVQSCGHVESDGTKAFITGTFYKKVDNEFNHGFDTLVISAINENVYRIIRYSSYQRIRNNEIMPLQRRSEIWTAIYNDDEHLLHETKKGKVLAFPDKATLLVGTSEYKKIKD